MEVLPLKQFILADEGLVGVPKTKLIRQRHVCLLFIYLEVKSTICVSASVGLSRSSFCSGIWDEEKYFFQREDRSVTNSIVIINLYNKWPLEWLYKHSEKHSKQIRQIKPESSSRGDTVCSTSYSRIMAHSLLQLLDYRALLPAVMFHPKEM